MRYPHQATRFYDGEYVGPGSSSPAPIIDESFYIPPPKPWFIHLRLWRFSLVLALRPRSSAPPAACDGRSWGHDWTPNWKSGKVQCSKCGKTAQETING